MKLIRDEYSQPINKTGVPHCYRRHIVAQIPLDRVTLQSKNYSQIEPVEVYMSFAHKAILLHAGEGKTISVLGDSYSYKATNKETGGAYALIEGEIHGDGPPPHIHATEEEAFYVLDGELEILIGEQTIRATTGAFVLIPRGTVHTFTRAGNGTAKILIIISPAGFEKFFEEIAGPPDLEKIMSLAPKYNLDFVDPSSKHHKM